MTPEQFGSHVEYLKAAGAAAIIAEKREIRSLEAKLAKVRHRHRPIVKEGEDGDKFNCCLECDGLREDLNENAAPILWPCDTVRDLDGDTSTETSEEAA